MGRELSTSHRGETDVLIDIGGRRRVLGLSNKTGRLWRATKNVLGDELADRLVLRAEDYWSTGDPLSKDRIWSHHVARALELDPDAFTREVERARRRDALEAVVRELAPRIRALPRKTPLPTSVPPPPEPGPHPPEPEPRPKLVRRPLEEHETDVATYRTPEEQRDLERNEAPLVKAFGEHLRARGDEVDRLSVEMPGRRRPYRIDLVNFSRGWLVEAKWKSTIDDARAAVGQLAHYRYLVEKAQHSLRVREEVVLFGSEPEHEIKRFLGHLEYGVVWRDNRGFVGLPPALRL
jgi:hypothetical protein